MPTLTSVIPALQSSTCAIMRLIRRVKQRGKKKPPQIEIALAFVGTGWCVTPNQHVVTANHIFNDGKPRDPNDRFYALVVPANGPQAYHSSVIGFALEDAISDLAIVQLGPFSSPDQHIQPIPVTFTHPPDGSVVATYGFPAPEIAGANVDPSTGQFLGGGQFFLKGHANEGIVAAQYDFNSGWHYEFNVGWHHGESGGPLVLLDPVAAFAVMQHYRPIKAPHGIVIGPHRGRSLEAIRHQLQQLGATIV